jgi:hypothetical protein
VGRGVAGSAKLNFEMRALPPDAGSDEVLDIIRKLELKLKIYLPEDATNPHMGVE